MSGNLYCLMRPTTGNWNSPAAGNNFRILHKRVIDAPYPNQKRSRTHGVPLLKRVCTVALQDAREGICGLTYVLFTGNLEKQCKATGAARVPEGSAQPLRRAGIFWRGQLGQAY